jgi:FkbM family methyltransferase
VYAFEPDPAARQLLQQTHGANRQVQVIPMAAADRNGQLAFTQRALSCNSSLGQTTEETGPNHQGNMLVQATALDSFCADRSISRIDLLKTDTEGADLRVLEGAKGLLAEQRIDAIMSEVFFVPTYRGQPTLEDLAGFLRSYGFGLFNIYIARETRCRQACYANVIFTSQRLTRKE